MKHVVIVAALFTGLLFVEGTASAHCDAADGPVAKAAEKAFVTGKVGHVLAWVQKDDEAGIREAFQKAQEVRKLSPEAKQLADRWFLETLVRVHRAGEGAPFTGINPAGRDFGPAIPAGDKALQDGNLKPVMKLVHGNLEKGLHARFEAARARRNYGDDPAAGRVYVAAYVDYIHYVEGIYEAAAKPAGHAHEQPAQVKGEGHEQHGAKAAPRTKPEVKAAHHEH